MKIKEIKLVNKFESVFDSKGMPKKVLCLDELENKNYDWKMSFFDSEEIKKRYFSSVSLKEFKEIYDLFKKDKYFFLSFSEIKEERDYNFKKLNKINNL
jgi:hypothetical protein